MGIDETIEKDNQISLTKIKKPPKRRQETLVINCISVDYDFITKYVLITIKVLLKFLLNV